MRYISELLKKTGIIAIGRIGTQIISFFLLPLYTSILSTSDYGEYDFVVTLVSFLIPLITLALEESMFRFLIDVNQSDKDSKSIISNTFFCIIINGIIITLFILTINLFIQYKYMYIMIIYTWMNILITLASSLTRGTGNIKLYSISNFLVSILIIILNILFLVIFNMGITSMFLSSIIANFIVSLFVFTISNVFEFINIDFFNKDLIKEMLVYSIPLVPNNLSWTIINLSDRFVIRIFLGNAANGIYAISNKFPFLVSTFFNFFYIAWKEVSAKIANDDESSNSFSFFYSIIYEGMMITVIIIILILPIVYKFLISSNYIESYQYIPILLMATFYLCIANYLGGIFTAYKETKIIGATTFIGAMVNIVINLLLMKQFGLIIASISTFISNYVVFIIRYEKAKTFCTLKLKNIKILWLLLIANLLLYYLWNISTFIVVGMFDVILIILIYKKEMFKMFSILKGKIKKC